MYDPEANRPHISRLPTEEIRGDKALMAVKSQLKKFTSDVREEAEDALRKQNTGLADLGQTIFSPDIKELLDTNKARLMSADEPKVPSIEVISKETLPPIYGKDLTPFVYKLHAVEVHQYIDIDGVDKPTWMAGGKQPEGLKVERENWVEGKRTGPQAPTFSMYEKPTRTEEVRVHSADHNKPKADIADAKVLEEKVHKKKHRSEKEHGKSDKEHKSEKKKRSSK